MKPLQYYAPQQISGKQSLTPEGYLLCEGVGIARTGTMVYAPGEVPISAGPDGIVYIDRAEREVFRPEFIASLQGKSVCDEHPPIDVNPDNLEQYEVGVVLNPRRGKGAQDDVLYADLLIKKRSAIEAVRAGKREISAGYDADYIETGVGRGEQVNMIANHVALVESGRCGPRCAIGDRNTLKERSMKLSERILNAFRSRDEKALQEALNEVPEPGATHVHVHVQDNANPGENEKGEKEGAEGKPGEKPNAKDSRRAKDDDDRRHRFTDAEIEGRFEKIEKKVDDMAYDVRRALDKKSRDDDDDRRRAKDDDDRRHGAKDDDDDRRHAKDDDDDRRRAKDNNVEHELEMEIPAGAAKTKDSVCLEEAFRQTIALSEIIMPGISAPTFDGSAPRQKTYDTICNMRRTTLELAYNTQPDVRSTLDTVLNGRSVRDAACADVRSMFAAVAALKRRSNNGGETRTTDFAPVTGPKGNIKTPADLNKRMREIYK